MSAASETVGDILSELESLGTAQNRKIYRRHGASAKLFGASYADVDKVAKLLRKRADVNDFASELWASGVQDARAVAARCADPATISFSLLDRWRQGLDCLISTTDLAGFAGTTPHAGKAARKWVPMRDEWTSVTGWMTLAEFAKADPDGSDENYLEWLAKIEESLQESSNWRRHAMVHTLIAIGSRSPVLRKMAEAVSRKIGPVEVDHGATSCKTPEPIPYLKKVWDRKAKKKS